VRIEEDGKWAADRWNPLYYLIRERQVALPIYPQFGTEPNGYYIPPRWVPRPYLVQMFGPGVSSAIEQYCCPDRDLLAVLQLFRATQQIIFRYEVVPGPKVAEIEVTMPDGSSKTQQIFNDTVIGYNKFGVEAARVTIEEPVFERPADLHVNTF
jgi:nitrate reductase beta subunit